MKFQKMLLFPCSFFFLFVVVMVISKCLFEGPAASGQSVPITQPAAEASGNSQGFTAHLYLDIFKRETL